MLGEVIFLQYFFSNEFYSLYLISKLHSRGRSVKSAAAVAIYSADYGNWFEHSEKPLSFLCLCLPGDSEQSVTGGEKPCFKLVFGASGRRMPTTTHSSNVGAPGPEGGLPPLQRRKPDCGLGFLCGGPAASQGMWVWNICAPQKQYYISILVYCLRSPAIYWNQGLAFGSYSCLGLSEVHQSYKWTSHRLRYQKTR